MTALTVEELVQKNVHEICAVAAQAIALYGYEYTHGMLMLFALMMGRAA